MNEPPTLIGALSVLSGIPRASVQKYTSGSNNPSEIRAELLERVSDAISLRVTQKMWRSAQKNKNRIRNAINKINEINMERAWARLNGEPWPPLGYDYLEQPRRWDCYRYAECLESAWQDSRLVMDCHGCDKYRPGDPGWMHEEYVACGRLINAIFFQDERFF